MGEDARLIPLRRVGREQGHCFVAPLPVAWPADSDGAPRASRLRLFEDGREIGPAHASHEVIRSRGGGAYSHWTDGRSAALFFSTSDNTAPGENGRSYVALMDVVATEEARQAALAPRRPHLPEEARSRRPVFVVGCARSGTTLLFNLLAANPELTPTDGYPDGEDHVGWSEVGGALLSGLGLSQDGGGPVGHHVCLGMDERHLSAGSVAAMHQRYRGLAGDGRVVNKCVHLCNKLRYVRAIFPDARFVHIVRDCLPVVASLRRMMDTHPGLVLYWPEAELPCFWVLPRPQSESQLASLADSDRFYPGGGEDRLVDYWSEVNRNVPLQLADTPEQLLTVRYEDLCADPAATLRRVFEFCELPALGALPLAVARDRNEGSRAALGEERASRYLFRAHRTRALFGYR